MSDCTNCKETKTAKRTHGEVATVPLAAVESERYHRSTNSRIVIACFCIVLVALTLCVAFCYKVNRDCLDKVEAMNKYWIDYISQYDFEDYTVDLSTDGGGNANYIGADGDIYNGTSNGTEENAETQGRQSEGEGDAP